MQALEASGQSIPSTKNPHSVPALMGELRGFESDPLAAHANMVSQTQALAGAGTTLQEARQQMMSEMATGVSSSTAVRALLVVPYLTRMHPRPTWTLRPR